MNSILKSQLIKRLSRFIKNLSADKITLNLFNDDDNSLENIELDEVVLMDLLELPTWLRLISAHCNQLKFSIKLANIKTVPIVLSLDVVKIVVETCEELRSPSITTKMKYFTSERYGFINKIIDGITVTIKMTYVVLNSPIFKTEIEIFGIVVQSKSPLWKKCSLPNSRVKNSKGTHVLIFKEVEWQCLRIEANSTSSLNLSPLKLLMDSACCRIVIKKRLSDSQILNSRLVLILEDVVWILTDSQLKAAAVFVHLLVALIRKSAAQTHKIKASRKLDIFSECQSYKSSNLKNSDDLFDLLDVRETSLHFVARRINFHFSDESSVERSSCPNLKNGAAFTINLDGLSVDYYPYHVGNNYNTHWFHYEEILLPNESNCSQNSNTVLMKSHLIIRLRDLVINKVSFSVNVKANNQFISSDHSCRKMLQIVDQKYLLQSEFVYYYYPDNVASIDLECPVPKFITKIYPIKIDLDFETLLWLNSFILSILKGASLFKLNAKDTMNLFVIEIDVCFVCLKVIVENKYCMISEENPENLTIQVINANVTNRISKSDFADSIKLKYEINEENCLKYKLDIYKIDVDFVYKHGLTVSMLYPIVRADPMQIFWDKLNNNVYVYWMYLNSIQVLINKYQLCFLDNFRQTVLRFFDFIKIDLIRDDDTHESEIPNIFLYFVLLQIQCYFHFDFSIEELLKNRYSAGSSNHLDTESKDDMYSFLSNTELELQDEVQLRMKKYIDAFVKINSEHLFQTFDEIEFATDVIEEEAGSDLEIVSKSDNVIMNNYRKSLESFQPNSNHPLTRNILTKESKVRLKLDNMEMLIMLTNLELEIKSEMLLRFGDFFTGCDNVSKSNFSLPIQVEINNMILKLLSDQINIVHVKHLKMTKSSDRIMYIFHDNLIEENQKLKAANELLTKRISELEKF